MKKVLITGATGNVGMAVILALQKIEHQLDVFAGVRDPKADHVKLEKLNVKVSKFDFNDVTNQSAALLGIDLLFLLRPPQISDVKKYFKPIIDSCKKCGVKHIVFLSVQGVEKSKIIPHSKIEKLIVESGIPYTFLRPAYFMQNFTGSLLNDLVVKKRIYLPAGKTKFTLLDVADIGAVAAKIIGNPAQHINKKYELTCQEKLNFEEMAKILSDILGQKIIYQSPNLLSFFIAKRKENMPTMLILVMIMLHYLPRFQQEPAITDWVEKIANVKAIGFKEFVTKNKKILLGFSESNIK